MPEWAQYKAKLSIQDLMRTHEQLLKLGIEYPHKEP